MNIKPESVPLGQAKQPLGADHTSYAQMDVHSPSLRVSGKEGGQPKVKRILNQDNQTPVKRK